MDAAVIQRLIDQENENRESVMLKTAQSLITTIVSTQAQIVALQKQINNARKQLKELSYEKIDAAAIMEET